MTARVTTMGDWPLLSLVTFLPLVGVAFIVVLRGDEEVVARNSRSVALWTSLLTFVLSLAGLGAISIRPRPGSSWSRRRPWLAGPRHQLPSRRRRHLALVRAAVGAADRGRRDRLLALGAYPGQGVHDRVSGHGHADDRRVRGARRGPVLPVLRGDPDPDVPDHRHLGRPAPDLCGLQVLPLHAAWARCCS